MFNLKRFHQFGSSGAAARMTPVSPGPRSSSSKTLTWWIEAIVLVFSVVCLVCAVTLALGAWGGSPREPGHSEAPQPDIAPTLPLESFEGIISDSHCAAKHSAAIGQSAVDCTRACVHAGERFVLIDREKTYLLHGDPFLLKKFAGDRVRVFGELNGKNISVSSASEI